MITLSTTPATGGSGSYRYSWYSKLATVGDWQLIPDENGTTYEASTPSATRLYKVLAEDNSGTGDCRQDYTNDVTVTVAENVTAGTLTGTQTVCSGTQPTALSLSSSSGGTSGSFTFQWQRKKDGSGWEEIQSATGETYTPNAADMTETTQYQVRVTDPASPAGCKSALSNIVTITIAENITVGALTGTQGVCSGTQPTALSLSSTSGGSGSFTYQWQRQKGTGNWEDIPFATETTYIPQAADMTETTNYKVKVTDQVNPVGCNTAFSTVATITVTPSGSVTAGTLGSTQVVCSGAQPTELSLNGSTGGSPLTYQWLRRTSPVSNWEEIPSVTGTTYTPSTAYVTETTEYQVRVTDQSPAGCNSALSNIVTVTFAVPIGGGTLNGSQTICRGAQPTELSLSGYSGGSGLSSLVFEWERKKASSSVWESLPASGTTYTPNAADMTETTQYQVRVTDPASPAGCKSALSNIVTITIAENITVGALTGTQGVCSGTQPTALSLSSTSGGSGSFTYQWQRQKGTGNWEDIPFATETTYIPQAADMTETTNYKVKVTDQVNPVGCNTAFSTVATITVTPSGSVTAGTLGSTQVVCSGAQPTELSLNGSTGGSPLTYQWLRRTSPVSNWEEIPSVTGTTYTPSTAYVTETTEYQVRVTDQSPAGCNSALSNIVTVTFAVPIGGGTLNGSQTICRGAQPTELSLSGYSGGSGLSSLVFEWERKKASSSVWESLPASGTTYTPDAVDMTETTQYRVQVTDPASPMACDNRALSTVATITVAENITVGVLSGTQIVCSGVQPGALTLSGASGGVAGSTNFTYRWRRSLMSSGGWWEVIPSATELTYTPPSISVSFEPSVYQYHVEVTDNAGSGSCKVAYSDPVSITVLPPPYRTNKTGITINSGSTYTLANSPLHPEREYSPVGTTYSWNAPSHVYITGMTSGPAEQFSQTLTNISGSNQTIMYTVTPTSPSGCVGQPFTITITVSVAPVVPEARDDRVSIFTCSEKIVNVLANDINASSGTLAMETLPKRGSAEAANGFIIYNGGAVGDCATHGGRRDTIRYKVCVGSYCSEADLILDILRRPSITLHDSCSRRPWLGVNYQYPGATYEWFKSPDGSGSWEPLPGSPRLKVYVTEDAWYKVRVTYNGDTVESTVHFVVHKKSKLQGNLIWYVSSIIR